jgi:hypothetical protein
MVAVTANATAGLVNNLMTISKHEGNSRQEKRSHPNAPIIGIDCYAYVTAVSPF